MAEGNVVRCNLCGWVGQTETQVSDPEIPESAVRREFFAHMRTEHPDHWEVVVRLVAEMSR